MTAKDTTGDMRATTAHTINTVRSCRVSKANQSRASDATQSVIQRKQREKITSTLGGPRAQQRSRSQDKRSADPILQKLLVHLFLRISFAYALHPMAAHVCLFPAPRQIIIHKEQLRQPAGYIGKRCHLTYEMLTASPTTPLLHCPQEKYTLSATGGAVRR